MTELPADPPDGVVYLDVDDALEIFGAIVGGTATEAADQLRDRAALAGALARLINYAQYENADLALQAGTLAHGIAETQPFIDGNKRAGLIAMLTFLEINGRHVDATDRELADWIISFSAGATPQAVAELLWSELLRPRLVATA